MLYVICLLCTYLMHKYVVLMCKGLYVQLLTCYRIRVDIVNNNHNHHHHTIMIYYKGLI